MIPAEGVKLEKLLEDYERSLLGESLRLSSGVKKQAAKLLGISFRSFRYRLEKLEKELGDLQERASEMTAKWQAERDRLGEARAAGGDAKAAAPPQRVTA